MPRFIHKKPVNDRSKGLWFEQYPAKELTNRRGLEKMARLPTVFKKDGTGARIIVRLVYQMRRRNVDLGLATFCIGGEQGMAMLVEAL